MEPSDWTRKTVRECLVEEFPGEWGADSTSGAANAIVLRSTDIDDDGHVNLATGASRLIPPGKLAAKRLRQGDLLLETSGGGPDKPVGRVALFQGDGLGDYLCSNFFRTLRPRQFEVDPSFLRWRLQFLYTRPDIQRFQQQTTGIINLKTQDYLGFSLRLPDLDEQRGIATIIDTVDDAIRCSARLIAKLEWVRKGLLHDLLTRGIDDNGELRDPERHREQFWESPIGAVPYGWEVITLARVGTWMSGGTPSKSVASFWDGAIPWASPKDMKSLWLDQTIDSVSPLGAASGCRIAPANSVLIVVRGMILAHTFPVSVISRPMAFNQDVKAVVPTAMDARFLAFWLVASADRLLGLVTESTHGTKRIELGDLHRHPIARPPLEEQIRILSVVSEQESRIGAEYATLAKLQLVKQGLMDDLLTGRARVANLVEGDAA